MKIKSPSTNQLLSLMFSLLLAFGCAVPSNLLAGLNIENNRIDVPQNSSGIYLYNLLLSAHLPEGVVGVSYPGAIYTYYGKLPYKYSIIGGSVPGLGLSMSTGQFIGTPSQAGNFAITVKSVDASGSVAKRDFNITIGNFAIKPDILDPPIDYVSEPPYYNCRKAYIIPQGGYAPFKYSIVAQDPDVSAVINPTTGYIEYCCGTTGGFLTLKIVDAYGSWATKKYPVFLLMNY